MPASDVQERDDATLDKVYTAYCTWYLGFHGVNASLGRIVTIEVEQKSPLNPERESTVFDDYRNSGSSAARFRGGQFYFETRREA